METKEDMCVWGGGFTFDMKASIGAMLRKSNYFAEAILN